MRFPDWQAVQFFGIVHALKERQHLAQLIRSPGRNPFYAILFVKLPQPSVNDTADLHFRNCSLLLYTCQYRLPTQNPSCTAPASSSKNGPSTTVDRCPLANTSRQGKSSVGFSRSFPV